MIKCVYSSCTHTEQFYVYDIATNYVSMSECQSLSESVCVGG